MNKTVISNLRVPVADWIQIKTLAAEQGLSVNEYIKRIINEKTAEQQLISSKDKIAGYKKKKYALKDLPKIMKNIPNDPDFGYSEEDKIIYDL